MLLGVIACMSCSGASRPLSIIRGEPVAAKWIDADRQRPIPVTIYGGGDGKRHLAIISNGYGGRNTDYRFIADYLVGRGYVVASIQQDLPGDPPMAADGDLRRLRRPVWRRGAETIAYVAARMIALGYARHAPPLLVGHSNGGDISMLYAAEHPLKVGTVFSLDNRRMPIPRTRRPRICSVRSVDFAADPGVLPTVEEQRRLGMRISSIPGLRHDDMWDGATPDQRAEILRRLAACLDLGPPA